MIGHANGIITIDLAESLDDRREALRVRLGRAVPHDPRASAARGRPLLPERPADRRRGLGRAAGRCSATSAPATRMRCKRHYALGAPDDWHESFISEYATMHPWEDFAETFAHYLHITGTLQTAAAIGIRLDAAVTSLRDVDVVPRESYEDQPIQRPADRLGVDVAGVQPHQPGDGLRRPVSVPARRAGPTQARLHARHRHEGAPEPTSSRSPSRRPGMWSAHDIRRPRSARDRRRDPLRREPASGAHRHRRVRG